MTAPRDRRRSAASVFGMALILLASAEGDAAENLEGTRPTEQRPDAVASLEGAPSPALLAKSIDYRVRDQSFREVIAILSMLSGVVITVEDAPDIQIRSMALKGSIESIIDMLADRFGFFYAFDGVRYTLTSREKSVTTVYEMPKAGVSDAMRLMDTVFPNTSADAIQSEPDLGVVLLRGSSDFIDAAKTILGRQGESMNRINVVRAGRPTQEVPYQNRTID